MKSIAAVDVLVSGGGIMGMAAAWRMADRGARVRLLELGRCGQGASQAALGALWPPAMVNAGHLQQLHRQSLWDYPHFLQALYRATGRNVPYLRQGKLELFSSEKALAQARQQTAAACEQWPALTPAQADQSPPIDPVMEMLSPAAARTLEPMVECGTLESQLCRWSAQVNVEELIAALRQACISRGVIIEEYTPATRLDTLASRVTGIIADGRTFQAEKYLICTGVWTHLLGQPVAPAVIDPVKGQAMLLQTQRPVLQHIVKRENIFLVPWPDGRILVGSTTEPEAGYDTINTPDGINFLRSGANGVCPALAEATVAKIWAGLRPAGPKRRPVMGKFAQFDNLYICAGHFKIGIGFAPLASQAMADLILDGQCAWDLTPFAPGRMDN